MIGPRRHSQVSFVCTAEMAEMAIGGSSAPRILEPMYHPVCMPIVHIYKPFLTIHYVKKLDNPFHLSSILAKRRSVTDLRPTNCQGHGLKIHLSTMYLLHLNSTRMKEWPSYSRTGHSFSNGSLKGKVGTIFG